MSIATRAEIKELLQIATSETAYDSLIDALIPVCTDIILTYTNNYFHTSKYITASTIAFIDSNPDTITDSGSGFVTAELQAGDIHVIDSADNDGYYIVDTVAAGTLTLDSDESLIAESAGESVTIYQMKFPKGLKLPFAMLIQSCIDQIFIKNVSSETLREHSVTYFSNNDDGSSIPANVKGMLKTWRKKKYVVGNSSTAQVGGT